MHLRVFAAVSCIVVVAAACGSESTSSGGNTTDGGSSLDGGSNGQDGASPGDGGGGKDGATPSDAKAGPFCASLVPAPTLCEDFDDGTPPKDSDTVVDPGASLGFDDTIAHSTPKSYRASVTANGAGVVNALLRTPLDFVSTAKTFVVAFELMPSAAPPAQGTLVVGRAFLSQTRSVAIELTSENGPVLREQEGALDKPSAAMTALPKANVWSRLELTIDLATKRASLRTNGAEVASLALTGTTLDFFAVNLGLQSDKTFTAWYDDVVFDVR